MTHQIWLRKGFLILWGVGIGIGLTLLLGLSPAWCGEQPAEEKVAPADQAQPTQPAASPEKEKMPQEGAAPKAPAAQAAAKEPPLREERVDLGDQGPFRKLAPGVLRTAKPAIQVEETYSRHDVLGLVLVHPDYTWAKNVRFQHQIWCLEFRYKPVRTLYVDIPQKNGAMQRKLIWYLMYSVSNTSPMLIPKEKPDGTYEVATDSQKVRFVPEFFLLDRETHQIYPDKIIPVAVAQIRLREDPNRTFYNTAEMLREIPVGQTVWGIVTWEDVDPRVDHFSIYVKGLTNAYKWEDLPQSYQKGDPTSGRKIGVKTLKLNFWRPGDEYNETENFVRTGIPPLLERGLPAQPEYEWVYLY